MLMKDFSRGAYLTRNLVFVDGNGLFVDEVIRIMKLV